MDLGLRSRPRKLLYRLTIRHYLVTSPRPTPLRTLRIRPVGVRETPTQGRHTLGRASGSSSIRPGWAPRSTPAPSLLARFCALDPAARRREIAQLSLPQLGRCGPTLSTVSYKRCLPTTTLSLRSLPRWRPRVRGATANAGEFTCAIAFRPSRAHKNPTKKCKRSLKREPL